MQLSKLHFIISCILISLNIIAQPTITYRLNGGRFGDNIRTYCKSKLIAHQYSLPLLYRPFKHSDVLALHKKEKYFLKDISSSTFGIQSSAEVQKYLDCNNLLVTHFYTETDDIYYTSVIDIAFGNTIKTMLKSNTPIATLDLPKDKITVAVHVRKGGGHDPPLGSVQQYDSSKVKKRFYSEPVQPIHLYNNKKRVLPPGYRPEKYIDKEQPKKFPPDQFYIDQIIKLSEILNDQPMFVYLFTDDFNPQELCNRYKSAVGKSNITFASRSGGGGCTVNVFEDFYSMALFDCLIRSESSFSQAVQLIGDHAVIIFPLEAHWVTDKVVVEKTCAILRDDNSLQYFLFGKKSQKLQNNIFLSLQSKRQKYE